MVLAVGAAGGLLGAAATPWALRRRPVGTVYVAATLVGTVPSLVIPMVTADRTVLAVVFAVVLFAMNAGLGAYNVLTATLRQVVTPDRSGAASRRATARLSTAASRSAVR